MAERLTKDGATIEAMVDEAIEAAGIKTGARGTLLGLCGDVWEYAEECARRSIDQARRERDLAQAAIRRAGRTLAGALDVLPLFEDQEDSLSPWTPLLNGIVALRERAMKAEERAIDVEQDREIAWAETDKLRRTLVHYREEIHAIEDAAHAIAQQLSSLRAGDVEAAEGEGRDAELEVLRERATKAEDAVCEGIRKLAWAQIREKDLAQGASVLP